MPEKKIIRENKKARHDFQLFETVEAGVKLVGSEVKSLREGRVSLNESFCKFKGKGLVIVNMNISEYGPAAGLNHKPKRDRTLLLHKYQLSKFYGKVRTKHVTIIPVKLYINEKGLVKIEIALASRRTKYDKRAKLREKEISKKLKRAG